MPRVVHPPPLIVLSATHPLFYLIVVCWISRDWAGSMAAGRQRWLWQRSGGGGGSAATAAAQRQRGGSAAAARQRHGVGGGRGGSLAAARRQCGGGGSFPSARLAVAEVRRRRRRWRQHGGGSSRVAAAWWQQAAQCWFFCANVCPLHLLPLALSLKPQRHKVFLRRREGQTTHYGLRKILRCTATKATLLLATGSCGQNQHKERNCASFQSTSEVER